MNPPELLPLFDQWLSERSLKFDAVVLGGVALSLLGVVKRETRDCDILHPVLPEEIRAAAKAFAAVQRAAGRPLLDDWLNNGPSSLGGLLPAGWPTRVQRVFAGKALQLSALGRSDLLKTKLFALCDRGTDLADCIALKPSREELDEALPWVEYQDANPDWPENVRRVLANLRRSLGHGV